MKQPDERQTRLKDLLLGEKRRLWNDLRIELFDKMGINISKQYDIPQDIGDRSVLDLLGDTGLALADIHSEQLTQLDDALTRLDNGRYGICDDCGKEIDEARLNISPYAACCALCQQQREGIKKASAHY